MPRKIEVSITRHPVTGAWVCTAILTGSLITRTYYGFTKTQALRAFRTEFRGC